MAIESLYRYGLPLYQRKPVRCSCATFLRTDTFLRRCTFAQATKTASNNAIPATYESANERCSVDVTKNWSANRASGERNVSLIATQNAPLSRAYLKPSTVCCKPRP